jgi:hypothetical protein
MLTIVGSSMSGFFHDLKNKGLCPLWQVQISNKISSLTGSKTSHLDSCTSMEHGHPSYAHIVL